MMRSSLMTGVRSLLLAIGCIVALAGCAQSRELVLIEVPAVGESITATVGASGGQLELAGVEITVPPGALAETTTITVTATDEAPPSWLRPSSPVLRFSPEGLSFLTPIEVRIPFRGDRDTATVFWSAREGDAFVPRATRIEGNVAIAESMHFSQAFVGSACEGEDCCDQANGQLDVLLMVDNSNSMSEEQVALAMQIPRLARALATGDSDGDGVQDFPALESVRVGVVSSDMGVGGFPVPTCDGGTAGALFGDDGVLRTAGAPHIPGCATSYPPVAEAGADSSAAELEAFVSQVSCVATIGTGGCGFEQQLESVLKALTPSSSSIAFLGGTSGHGDGANAGFLRDDSMLAVVLVTDETDCSAANAEIFDPANPAYSSVDLNLRCYTFADQVHPTDRYVDGMLALRDDPADLIFATISGVPTDLAGAPLEDVLDDPRMQESIDPSMTTRLSPSCNVPGVGIAMPPRRIVQVARDLDDAGAQGVAGSICQEDFTPVIDALLRSVASRARGECS